ncbi:hypothetical protein TNCV_615711 [Trichonephila clavipes]|nr:hypothetical protein TNCV_615711 [Trichonephila clavipes]
MVMDTGMGTAYEALAVIGCCATKFEFTSFTQRRVRPFSIYRNDRRSQGQSSVFSARYFLRPYPVVCVSIMVPRDLSTISVARFVISSSDTNLNPLLRSAFLKLWGGPPMGS